MRVMIVDDELPIREWLQYSLQKAGLPIDSCTLCANGTEALESFRQLRPALVFTDIKMPDKDGIELLQEIRSIDPHVYIVMLTSHDNFDYVRRSLKYQANEYILKSEISSEILIRICEAAEKQRRTTSQTSSQPSNAPQPLHELLGTLPDREIDPSTLVQLLGNSVTAANFFAFFTIAISMHSLAHHNGLHMTLERIVDGTGTSFKTFYFDRDSAILLATMPQSAGQARYQALRRELTSRLFSELNCTLGVSGCFHGAQYFPKAVSQAVDALVQQDFSGEGPGIFFAENLFSREANVFDQELREILRLISRQQTLNASAQIRCLLEDVMIPTIPKAIIYDGLAQIVTALQLTALNRNMTSAYNACQHALITLENCNRFPELRTIMLELLDTVDRELGDRTYSQHIQQAIALIHSEYATIRRIADVSDRLNLNPEYFCRMFKQETGTTFNTYLTNYRIQIAKDLLNTTDQKINDIAQAVGYPNLSYFSRVFKSVTGVAPFRFRDQREEPGT